MKIPVWEASPGALVACINGLSFVSCELFTATLTGGEVLRFTNADVDVTYPGGPVWSSKGVRVDKQGTRTVGAWKRGLDADNWTIVVMPRLVDIFTGAQFPDKIGIVPWLEAAGGGALDNADWQVDRAYFPAWPQPYQAVVTPAGILTLFAGVTAEVDVGDTTAGIVVNDYRDKLRQKAPIDVFQAGCNHTLFDAGCQLDPDDFKISAVLVGGSTRQRLFTAAIVPPGSATFTLGRVRFTSGMNAGFSRTVAAWTAPGSLELMNPLSFDVTPGDAFDVFPGCDKAQDTCIKFGNLVNFGGQSYIPSPETAI